MRNDAGRADAGDIDGGSGKVSGGAATWLLTGWATTGADLIAVVAWVSSKAHGWALRRRLGSDVRRRRRVGRARATVKAWADFILLRSVVGMASRVDALLFFSGQERETGTP